MPIAYKVTTAPAEKENFFNITWNHVETGEEATFEQSAAGISREEVETLWQKPQHQLQIGQKLFRFLDGEGTISSGHWTKPNNTANYCNFFCAPVTAPPTGPLNCWPGIPRFCPPLGCTWCAAFPIGARAKKYHHRIGPFLSWRMRPGICARCLPVSCGRRR